MKKQACITVAIFGLLYTATAQLSTNNAVIDGGNYQGDPGGLSFIPEVVFGADRINGLNMTGANTINAGTFTGGEGSSAFPQMIRSGGAGVAITGGTNIINGGTFSGGLAASDLFDDGVGISVEANNQTAKLSLLGGVLSDGMRLHAHDGGQIDLSISTNVQFSGILFKSGDGELAIQDWQSGTLQEVDLQGGSILLTNLFELGGSGGWTMASGTVLRAEGGLDLAGAISGESVTVSHIEVVSNLYLSGSVSGVKIDLMGGENIFQLDGGSYASSIIDAMGANDKLSLEQAGAFSASSLGLGATLLGFEQIEMNGAGTNVWELGETELSSSDYAVLANGAADMLAFAEAGFYSNTLFTAATNYSGFERYGLSTGDDTWFVADNDASALGQINGRTGSDLLDFEYHVASAEEIGEGLLYEGFEGARLSSTSNLWQAGDGYGDLAYIDGRGSYALVFSGAVDTNAVDAEIGANSFYRNFESVQLDSLDDIWSVTSLESGLSFVDGGDGVDTLRGALSDALMWVWVVYTVTLKMWSSHRANTWAIGAEDDGLNWIDALGGTDVLKGDLTDSSEMGATALYRNFEQVDLDDGDDAWTASTRDAAIGLNEVNGGTGVDTLSYMSYEAAISEFSQDQIEERYLGFEEVELTSDNDIWRYGISDMEVNARGGQDTLLVETSLTYQPATFDDYEGFETLHVAEGTLSLGDDSLVWNGGTYRQGAEATLSFYAKTNMTDVARLTAADLQFDEGARLVVEGEPSNWSIGNRYTNLIAQATSTLTIEQLNGLVEAGSGFEVKDWYIDNAGIYTIFDRRSLADPTNGIFGSLTLTDERILREIDTLTTDAASSMIDEVFAQSEGPDRYTAEDVNRVYQRSIAMPRAVSHQRNGSLRTLSERISERRMMLFESKGPRGVRAPSLRSQKGNALWFKGYSANGSASEDGALEGYDLTGIGSTIGFDAAIEEWVLGTSAGVFNQTLVMDESGEYSGAGTHVGAYVSYGIEGWFFEANAVLANTTLELVSEEGFGLEAEYTASDASFYIGAGYIMRDEKQAWTPEAGLLIYSYAQDEAADTGGLSVPVELDSFTQAGMQMRLGLTGAFRRMFIGRELLTQVKLRWMNHITVLDEESDFRLAGGDATYQMALLNAPKSLVELGLGAQLRMNRSFSLLMGFDYETGGGYSANRLSAGVRYNF